GPAPAQIAAVRRGAGVLGGRRRDAGKGLALQDAVAQLAKLLPNRFVIVQLVRLQQDVAHVNLIDDDLCLTAAALIELDDVKAAGRADGVAHFARLHLGDEIQNELRQLSTFSPSQLTAVQ